MADAVTHAEGLRVTVRCGSSPAGLGDLDPSRDRVDDHRTDIVEIVGRMCAGRSHQREHHAALVGRLVDPLLVDCATRGLRRARPVVLRSQGDLDRHLLTLIRRTDGRGPEPRMQALARSDSAPEIRDIARDRLTRILVEPLTRMLDARLRAGVALAGILVVRGIDSLPAVGKAAGTRLGGAARRGCGV